MNVKMNAILLSAIAFVVNLGFGAAMPLLPFLLLYYDGLLTDIPENLGTISNAAEIAFQMTVLMAAFMLARSMLARYFGRLSDSVGRKRVVTTGLALYTLLSFMYALSTNWLELLAVRSVQGVASAMVWPVAEAMLTDSVPWNERGKYMGWYMTFSNVSFFAGPVLGAYLYKFAIFYLTNDVFLALIFPFYVMTVISFVGFLLSFLTIETVLSPQKILSRKTLLKKPPEPNIKLPPMINRSIKVLYILGLANGVAMGFVAPISSVFVIQYITSDPAAMGWLSTVAGIAGFIVNYPSGRLSDRFGRRKLVITGQLASRTATFLVPFVRTFDQLVGVYSLRSMAFNISSPPFRALQADLVPKRLRGKVFGTVQSMFNLGAALAPIGGILYQISNSWHFDILGYWVPGVAVSFWFSALIGLVATILFILYVKEPTPEEKEELSKLDILEQKNLDKTTLNSH
ncbi:MAG: MFS transporter [Candidatus Odinarchaeota archaeon]|nr:MFS transporter [Candidatus Odinarchaeota archaeon]